jgi:hypothetical protein
MLTEKKAIPLERFAKGGKSTKKRHGKGIFSLIVRVRHEKDPKKKAALRKKIAALVASKNAAKSKR